MREPPKMTIVEDSEIWGEVDLSALRIDGIFRPIFIACEDDEFTAMDLTVDDARRLLAFLNEAIFFLDGASPRLVPQ